MLRTLTTLLVFQFAGESVSYALKLPIPGPVIGMLLLFGYLLIRRGEAERLKSTAQELLRHLSLLFVPAGVGVMLYADRVRQEWLPIVVSVIASTAATLIVTAVTADRVERYRQRRNQARQSEPR
ncbi:MAG: CidA/LrgA family protein [Burkholderiaceae bacterium]|jgi:holin-like protein